MTAPVHVVGGGFAGAAAAVRLAEAGLRVVLWEPRENPGGRVNTFVDPDSGETLDNGPHLFMGCYRRTRALLARLGTDRHLMFQSRLRLPLHMDGRRLEVSCPPLPGPLSLAVGLLGMGGLSPLDRLRLLRAGQRLRAGEAVRGSVFDWLLTAGVPWRSIRMLWDPLCRAVMNLPPDEAEAGPFVAALRTALLGRRDEAVLGWATAGLGALLGKELGNWLSAHGGELRRERVARVVTDPRGGAVAGVETGEGCVVKGSWVVVATDPFAAAGLLPDGAEDLIARLRAFRPSPIVSAYYWLDRPVVPMSGETPFAGLIGGPAEWLFDRDRMAGRGARDGGQRLAVVTSAAGELAQHPSRAVADLLWRDVARHFPAARRARLVRARVVKEGRATVRLDGTVPRPPPGAVIGVPGLYLCGDYTATGLPATIEGAAVSGERAAEAVLDESP